MSINRQPEASATPRGAAVASAPTGKSRAARRPAGVSAPESTISPALVCQLRVEGERWGDEVLRSVRDQRRRVRGGWPGTVAQARERLWFYVFQGRDASEFAAEQALAVRYLYRIARARWNAAQERELPGEDSE